MKGKELKHLKVTTGKLEPNILEVPVAKVARPAVISSLHGLQGFQLWGCQTTTRRHHRHQRERTTQEIQEVRRKTKQKQSNWLNTQSIAECYGTSAGSRHTTGNMKVPLAASGLSRAARSSRKDLTVPALFAMRVSRV